MVVSDEIDQEAAHSALNGIAEYQLVCHPNQAVKVKYKISSTMSAVGSVQLFHNLVALGKQDPKGIHRKLLSVESYLNLVCREFRTQLLTR
jgi:hypothetical protein